MHYKSNQDLQELFKSANIELAKAETWFKANKLTLNVSKTKFMVFRKPTVQVNLNSFQLKIGEEVLERIGFDCKTKSYKFVGLHIDEYLSWETHISHVHAKLSSANYIINSSKTVLPKNIRLTVYNSIF